MKPRVSILLPWAIAGLVWAVFLERSVCHAADDPAANKSMQGPQKLDLRVLDHQRNGVANVEISIEDKGVENPLVFRTDAEGRVELNAEFRASDTICFSACAVRVAIGIKAVDWPCEIILPKTRPLEKP